MLRATTGPSKLRVQVIDIHHDAPVHARLQQIGVPLAQLVVLGRLLVLGMDVEDVVIALQWRARPDVRRVEAAHLHVVQVADDDLVIDQRAVLARTQVVHESR